jgi:hypothetical protein
MTEQRRLATIVSAVVAGYSRLMGRDESAATTVVTKTIKLCTGAGRRTITFNYRSAASGHACAINCNQLHDGALDNGYLWPVPASAS